MPDPKEKQSSLRSAILSAADMKPEKVKVEEWGETIYLWPLDGAQRFRLTRHVETTPETENNYVLEGYVVLSAKDADGRPIFTWDDREELSRKNPIVIGELAVKVMEISGMQTETEEDAVKK